MLLKVYVNKFINHHVVSLRNFKFYHFINYISIPTYYLNRYEIIVSVKRVINVMSVFGFGTT